MKHIFLCSLLITLSILSNKSAFGGDAVKPTIKFDKTTHDFGNLPQGKPVTYDFEFTNTGKTSY
jgi:hypothetical protein